ncbi:MAG: hypothetical protein MJE68_19015 [Proteobacteria bacterium]|nr:hypothetical protein [Pseudomonadota bacterium]
MKTTASANTKSVSPSVPPDNIAIADEYEIDACETVMIEWRALLYTDSVGLGQKW